MDHRRQADELFDAALERRPEERQTFVDERCKGDPELRATVMSLLAADDRSGPFLDPPVRAAAVDILSEFTEAAMIGQKIGRYRIQELVASGGMGTVFKAAFVDDNESGSVAVKLIRRGMDTRELVKRFHLERQTLSALVHPNIARMLDGGVTERGVPYLVMEYIEGKPIDQYCDERRLGVADRVRLIRTVCTAVQHAHQNLVIHRDIKPSNILVTNDGTPKLVDFGIAKLVSARDGSGATVTATSLRLVTPQYASPEVVRGESPSTSMDVYSLGLVAYELLTGRRPYDILRESPREMERIICEMDPPPPSSLVTQPYEFLSSDGTTRRLTPELTGKLRQTTPQDLRKTLRGDLDTVVLMALRKDPRRRYASVEQFGQDLERYLSGFPVLAQKDSLGYRTWKFVRRNKVGVGVAGLVLLTLIGGIAGTTYGLVSARREAARSKMEAAKAASINTFLQDMLSAVDPETGSAEMKVRVVLDLAAGQIDRELKDQPEVWQAVKNTIGETYLSLGMHKEAEPHLRAVLEARRASPPRDDDAYVQSLTNLGRLLRVSGVYDEAQQYLNEAIELATKRHGGQHLSVARAYSALSAVCVDRGDFAGSEKLLRQALTIYRRAYGEEHRDVASCMEELGLVLVFQGKHGESERLARQALTLSRKLYTSDHVRVSSSLRRMATILHQEGKFAEAEPHYREALAMDRKLLGNEHPNVARVLNNLGPLLNQQGNSSEAEAALREALAIRRKLFGTDHISVAVTLNNLATVLDAESADPLLRESLAISRKLFGPNDYRVGDALQNLATSLRTRGRYDEAEPLYVEALAIHRKSLGPKHVKVSYSLVGLGDTLTFRGKPAEAEPLLREALVVLHEHFPADHPSGLTASGLLGKCLMAQGRLDDAEEVLEESLKTAEKAGTARENEATRLAHQLATLYDDRGTPEKAQALREKFPSPTPAADGK